MKICIDCKEVTDEMEDLGELDGDPICSECKREHVCRHCYGSGKVAILRDETGRINYIRGRQSGETERCSLCQGKGYR